MGTYIQLASRVTAVLRVVHCPVPVHVCLRQQCIVVGIHYGDTHARTHAHTCCSGQNVYTHMRMRVFYCRTFQSDTQSSHMPRKKQTQRRSNLRRTILGTLN